MTSNNPARTVLAVLVAIGGLGSASLAQSSPEPSSPEPSSRARTAATADLPRATALESAREIDRLVRSELARHGVTPNPLTDDATFVRRAYLGIVGRIPTVEETEAFLESRSRQKRPELVDRLLDSPGHVSHMFNYWADILRAKSRLPRATSGEPYLDWIKQSIAADKPYDEFVRELLTASGPAHERGNGSTGFYLRDLGMPEDNMSNAVRIFLGTRLECAQCHDHPFDAWTQKQYFETVAFTGGIQYQDTAIRNTEKGRQIQALSRKVRAEHGRDGARALNRLLRPVSVGISGSGSGLVRLPHDYQYDDAKPDQILTAKTMFGDAVDLDVRVPRQSDRRRGRRAPRGRRRANEFPEADTRDAYAQWMTSPDNPRFTKVIANRMWKHAMGVGLIEPVDDLKDDTEASNPALMARLERLMVDLDYDLLEFLRVLYNTETWQREATPGEPSADEPYLFAGPALRRMTAEQLWDSLLTLVVPDLDARPSEAQARAEAVYRRYDEFLGASDEELMAQVEVSILRYTDPEKFRAEQRRLRAERVAQRRREQAERSRTANRARALQRELQKARRSRDRERIAEIIAELQKLGFGNRGGGRGAQRGRGREQRGLVRASDLPSPAPPGHLLRQFGQSDREQIQAADPGANVPQVLTMLNGFVDQRLLRAPNAVLMRAVADRPAAREKIRTAFLGTLSREPSSSELEMWRSDFEQDPDQATRDLVWTLLNVHEFKFIQ